MIFDDTGDPVRRRVEELLGGLPPEDRVKGESLAEAARRSGWPLSVLYRAVASHELEAEQASVPRRKNGRRGAGRIRVTPLELARWRARRMTQESAPICKVEELAR